MLLMNQRTNKITVEPLMSQTILPMSLYVSGSGNISVALLSLEGQKARGFHQKHLNLCSKDERRSYGFGTT